ncbi:MAG: 2TM domain-containing protein [Myxococcales bacterium]|nr:2TM domain-containing protein [Myxococcales bacterium]
MTDEARRYSEAEVDSILRRVIARDDRAEGMSRAEIADVLAQLGIGEGELDDAIAEHDDDQRVEAETAAWRVKQQAALRKTAISMGAFGALFIVLNVLTSPGSWWFVWPLGAWAFALARQALNLYQGPSEAQLASVRAREARRAERASRKAERAERKARKRARQEAIGQAREELEEAVTAGVTGLLKGIQKGLRGAAGDDAVAASAAPRRGVRIAPTAEREAAPVEALDVEDDLEVLRRRVAEKGASRPK